MQKILVGFILKFNGREKYHSAVVYMPDGYDYTKDVNNSNQKEIMENFVPEEQFLFPELKKELHENRKRWGEGDMYKPEAVEILSVTSLGEADRDVSWDVNKKHMEAIDEDLKFGAAAKMMGSGV